MSKEETFTQLIKEHQGLIYKVSALYTEQQQDQNDLYQEIVYQLWKSYDSFRGDAKLSTWMYRVALNTAIGQLKKKKRAPNTVSIDQSVVHIMDDKDTELEERIKVLNAQIKKLNILDRGLILLLLEGKKYEEIAEITGLSHTNVATRISRIKQKLKSKMIKK
jgi:RNA polymerase sigma-70 factor (ECF subfamily)